MPHETMGHNEGNYHFSAVVNHIKASQTEVFVLPFKGFVCSPTTNPQLVFIFYLKTEVGLDSLLV